MKTNKTANEQLKKYLLGEMDSQEADNFRQNQEENNLLKNIFETENNQLQEQENMNSFNTNKAWSQLKSRLEKEGLVVQKTRVIAFRTALRIAAGLAIIAVLGTMTYQYFAPETIFNRTFSSNNQIRIDELLLEDGTKVSLNTNSTIVYPDRFEGKTREVEVKSGEAFFDVTKNAQKPFVISAGNISVKVLGTSFSVKLNENTGEAEVFVNLGKVAVSKTENPKELIYLLPGELGVFTKGKLSKIKTQDANRIAWKTGKLVFNGQSLGEVFKILEKTYNIRFNVQDSTISKFRLTSTSTFENESINDIMSYLETTFTLKIKTDENNVIQVTESN